MTDDLTRTPRSQHPFPAVLVGAGFFIFLAVLGMLGPLGAWEQALWQARQPGAPLPLAGSAMLLRGSPQSSSPAARAMDLARDVAWLRAHGSGPIVVEAWLDEAPQAEARALEQSLLAQMESLPRGRTKRAVLKVLSDSTANLDASQKLADALAAAQPLLLAFATAPGHSDGLAPALRRQAYEVTLHGHSQTAALPPQQVLHLPYPEALEAVGRCGAVPNAVGDEDALPAVLEVDGLWFNALGLEAARLTLGLPLEALRYRWKQGRLNTLELKGVRYPVDERGRLALPGSRPSLESEDLDRVMQDPVLQRRLRGRTVFLRPWPKLLGESAAFEQQERLFAALVERDVLAPPTPDSQRILWLGLWALGWASLALAPLWAGILGWSVLPVASLYLALGADSQGLVQPWGLALGALCLGLGWRIQRLRNRRHEAERWTSGRAASRHQGAWRQRLAKGRGSLAAAYAVAGPRVALSGPSWEAWMERWGAMVDEELGADACGLVLPDLAMAPAALTDLRQVAPVSCGVAQGVLSFQLKSRLGAPTWLWSGPVRDEALALFQQAKVRQILLLERDYPVWRGLVQIQVIGQSGDEAAGSGSGQVLNLLSLTNKV